MNDEEMNESGKYLRLLYSHLNKRIKARSALLRLSLPGLLSQRPGVKAQRGRGSGPTGASAWSGHLGRTQRERPLRVFVQRILKVMWDGYYHAALRRGMPCHAAAFGAGVSDAVLLKKK